MIPSTKREILAIRSLRVAALQRRIVRRWHQREDRIHDWSDALREMPVSGGSLAGLAASLALINTYQWHEEDKARATDVSDGVIAQVKRNIDLSNQRRVNEIEKLDLQLERILQGSGLFRSDRLPLSSETPGSIIDRLSILILKIYHMAEQSRRKGFSAEQKKKYAERLKILHEQLEDLSACLDHLISDLLGRRRRFKTYFQFKMYNDPETNPYIKASPQQPTREG